MSDQVDSELRSPFLTDEQVVDMTGLRQSAAQIRWLTQNGVKHWIRADGKPRVPRWVAEGRQESSATPDLPSELTQPDFGALRRVAR